MSEQPPLGENASRDSPDSGSTVAERIDNITVMTLEGRTRQGFTSTSLDVSTTIAIQREAASARRDRYALAERFDHTSSQQARVNLLFERTTQLQIRASELRARESRLRDTYRNRSIDTGEFVRRLALLDARVASLERRLDHVRTLARPTSEAVTIIEQLDSIHGRISGLHGPAREEISIRFSGSTSPTQVFAAASANGTVVALIDGDQYIREAYRVDFRTPGTAPGFGIADANARTRQLYPTASDIQIRHEIGTYAGATSGVLVISFHLPTGSITALLDGSSTNVYYEVQRRDLNRLSSGPSVSVTANGTQLVVNRTFPGGPLRIATYDNATGDPISVPVRVRNELLLTTGEDGVVWTIGPRGQYPVTAIGPNGNTTIKVWEMRPPTLR